MDDWHSSVYHAETPEGDFDDLTKKLVSYRDKHKCLRCGSKKELTIHHIIPRDEGGTEELSNLMLLCRQCHNYIECLDLRTRDRIINEPDENDAPVVCKDEIPDATDWRLWVYGGYRNPNL